MSETTVKTTAEKAKAAGAKNPADKKKATSAKVKAMQAEAKGGDRVVEFKGEGFTLQLDALEENITEDYEFLEQTNDGNLQAMIRMIRIVLSPDDQDRLKNLVRNPDTGKIKTETYVEAFGELMEAAGQGN